MIECEASLFRNEFNKYNDTGTRMFDFMYVKSFEFVLNSHFWVTQKLLKTSSHNVICKLLVKCDVIYIYHYQARRNLRKRNRFFLLFMES